MTTLHDIRERRAGELAQVQEFLARHERGETLTEAEFTAWKRHLDEHDRLSDLLGAADSRSHGEGGRSVSELARRASTAGAAFEGEHRARESAFRRYLVDGDEVELRAQGVTTGLAGGYTVPTGFRAHIVETMKSFGGLRRLAEHLSTDTGADLPWPTNDDTSNVGGILTENTQVGDDDFEFGTGELGAYMYTSKMVKVSRQLLQDNGVNLESWLAFRLGRRIGRGQAPHWVTGTGTGQPQGLLTGTTTGKTAGSTSAITYDDLVDLVHSVDAAYREGGELGEHGAPLASGMDAVAWLMNDQTLATIRKITDLQDRPLLEPDTQRGVPNTILGYRVVIDNAMPAIAASASPIAFGNVRAAYVIRDVGNFEVLRLVERYADYLQVGFLGYQRSDGMVQDASAVKKLTMAAA